MTLPPDTTPPRAWTLTQDTLKRINYSAALLITPPTLLWNALRLTIPGERLLLAAVGAGILLMALGQLYRTGHLNPNRRGDAVIDVVTIVSAAVTVLIHWRFDQPTLASGATILALLAPSYFMRWNVVYVDRPRRSLGLSVTYLLLSAAALAATYVRGHPDIDPLTVLLLGSVQLFHIADFRRVARQVDTERDGRDAAERRARHDALTGLLNRRAFESDAAALDPARRHSLIVLDIDRFKAINDGHGHDIGDQVLAGLAARLQTLVQHHGQAYRWGGEEFAVLLPNTIGLQAAEIAETVRRRVAEQPVAGLDVTVSLGTGEWQPELKVRENFVLVDTALRHAKEHGRNRVCHAGRTPVPAHLH